MQIIDTTNGNVVEYEPGKSVEVDFINDCIVRIVAKGVGIGKTEASVSQSIRDGITESIQELKLKVVP